MSHPDVMVGASNHLKRCIGEKLGDLLDRPAWTNILLTVEEERRSIQLRDLSQERRALDIRLPRAVDLSVHLQVGRIVEGRECLQPLVAPLAVDAVPLAVVVNTSARDTDQAQHPL